MRRRVDFKLLLWPLVCLLAFSALVFVERSGIGYGAQAMAQTKNAIPTKRAAQDEECLLLYDAQDAYSCHKNLEFVLSAMRVGYRAVDVRSAKTLPAWEGFQTVAVAFADLDLIQKNVFGLLDWVRDGGRVLFAVTPEPNTTLRAIYGELGIHSGVFDYVSEDRVEMLTDLLPGGKGGQYHWGGGDRFGLAVQLDKTCTIHMRSVGEVSVPMLWEKPLGNGRLVVCNNDAMGEKESRGLAAAAYSLLEDICAYPVIDASVFFIDDFPAQIPEGSYETIYRQYQRDVDSFYTNVWFPDMLRFARTYGLRYTALFVETYGDSVTPPFEPLQNADRFRYFGALLLENGFEIGLHGYNHMPFVLESFDYGDYLDYVKWQSEADMASSVSEALRFANEYFPGAKIAVYVPPSNVVSDEGRTMLKKYFPQIDTVCTLYIDNLYGLDREFAVDESGVADFPRITWGCTLDEASLWDALNGVSLYYVSSHFVHPDDALDLERSRGKDWAEMADDFEAYIKWLYGAAKGIRSMTASEAGDALRLYDGLSVKRTRAENKLALEIGGFSGEAYFLVRLNGGVPFSVAGGTLQGISEGLYLLHAEAAHVEIGMER